MKPSLPIGEIGQLSEVAMIMMGVGLITNKLPGVLANMEAGETLITTGSC